MQRLPRLPVPQTLLVFWSPENFSCLGGLWLPRSLGPFTSHSPLGLSTSTPWVSVGPSKLKPGCTLVPQDLDGKQNLETSEPGELSEGYSGAVGHSALALLGQPLVTMERAGSTPSLSPSAPDLIPSTATGERFKFHTKSLPLKADATSHHRGLTLPRTMLSQGGGTGPSSPPPCRSC